MMKGDHGQTNQLHDLNWYVCRGGGEKDERLREPFNDFTAYLMLQLFE